MLRPSCAPAEEPLRAASAAAAARRGGAPAPPLARRPAAAPRPRRRPGRAPAPAPPRAGLFGGGSGGRAPAPEPFPWSADDYYRVGVQLAHAVPGAPPGGPPAGVVLLCRLGAGGEVVDPDRGLVLSVGGDTLAGIALLLSGGAPERPLTLDLLWSLLRRGAEASGGRDWRLLRVAIVALRGDVFLGRAFFGGAGAPAGAPAVWDVDCRPSDALWLSLKSGAPAFCRRAVWEANAVPLRELGGARGDGDGAPPGRRRGGAPGAEQALEGAPAAHVRAPKQRPQTPVEMMTAVRPSDPEPLKLLKRELGVALAEEDYAAAARLRDHPFLRLHLREKLAAAAGDRAEEAARLGERLRAACLHYERSGMLPEDIAAEDGGDAAGAGAAE